MAYSKIILNGETLMDVTGDTVDAGNLLSGKTATKNSGAKVTGNIASKSSSDLTVSGATVTAPAGYYSAAASKAVATTTHPNPTAAIASSTGVVTATHTQTTGYVTGGTTTGTLNLTTQAGKTVTPTESAQTAVASYRWTTGPVSVAAISSTYVGTGVAKKSAADLTASGATVTVPVGYYSSAVTKTIGGGTATTPAKTITTNPTIGVNTSGVITASYNGSSSITPTVTAGYVSQGTAGTVSTAGTATSQLTSQAATTYNTSTADRTIASQRWLVGAQTIKSVTTSNLTAANIKSGTVVKVGDANNASRITQVTGTLREGTPHTAILRDTGNSSYCYVQYNGTKYYTYGDTFTFYEGDTLTIYCKGNSGAWFKVGAAEKNSTSSTTAINTTYSLPGSDINIYLYYYNAVGIEINVVDFPLETPGDEMGWIGATEEDQYFSVESSYYGFNNFTIAAIDSTYVGTGVARKSSADLTASGSTVTVPVGYYSSQVTKNVASATHLNPTAAFVSSTGVFTATHAQTAGYVAEGFTTSTYNLTTQAAQTLYPSTADQTIASYRWLTGTQTIKSVTTLNLTASNIVSGVTVKVGDSNNASRITQVTGTYAGGEHYNLFKSLAYRSTIFLSTETQISSWCSWTDTLSSITFGQFANQKFLGSLVLNNVTTIESGAFAWYPYAPTGNYSFNISCPSCTYISPNAFFNNGHLISANFPLCNNVGASAFEGCNKLQTISFPECTVINANAFSGCSQLTSINFPKVSIIHVNAFSSCSNLTTVSFSTCSKVYDEAFANCYKLSTISFPVCTEIATKAFYQCNVNLTSIYFPSCTFIGGLAFAYCRYLSSISFPVCASISASAFWNCYNLLAASFPMCTSLSASVFSNCSKLTSINFPILESLPTSAFTNLSALTTVNIPECITVGTIAFQGCSALSTVSFSKCTFIEGSAFRSCYSLNSINIPACISVGSFAFGSCSNLTSVNFSQCTYVGKYAFTGCTNLSEVNLPSATMIEEGCFNTCSSLQIVSLPQITSFGYYVFSNCWNLISLYLTNVSSVPTFGYNMFYSTPISSYSTVAGRYGSIFVPSSLYTAFTTATSWKAYSARMVSV